MNDQILHQMYLMNDDGLYPRTMKIKEVFQWTQEFYGCFDLNQAYRLSKQFGLDTKKRIKELSTGYQSIFQLIVALCLDVPYIFLDEPVLGLDATHREMCYKILLDSYTNHPRTIIIATHLIEEITNLIEHIVIIDEGKVIANESVETLLEAGYSVSGSNKEVDAYCVGKHVLGVDQLGSFKTAYILGKQEEKEGLQFSSIHLQKLFVEMTKKEKEL